MGQPTVIRDGAAIMDPNNSTNAIPNTLKINADGSINIGATIDTTPSSSATVAIVPAATAAVASNLVAKASAGNLYGFNVVNGASAGYVMVFNATAAPADGAVTPLKCYTLAANSSIEILYDPPVRCGTGVTLVFSTTGPFTKTASATAFISAEAV